MNEIIEYQAIVKTYKGERKVFSFKEEEEAIEFADKLIEENRKNYYLSDKEIEDYAKENLLPEEIIIAEKDRDGKVYGSLSDPIYYINKEVVKEIDKILDYDGKLVSSDLFDEIWEKSCVKSIEEGWSSNYPGAYMYDVDLTDGNNIIIHFKNTEE